MDFKLYNHSGSDLNLNKILTLEKTFKIKMLEDISKTDLEIILKSDVLLTSNYAYLEEFKRYYFIKNIEVLSNKLFKIILTVDVLMSFKAEILNSGQEVVFNIDSDPYYDADYLQKNSSFNEGFKSSVVFKDEKSIILNTFGEGV